MLQRLSLLWKRFTPLEEQLFAQIRTVLPHSMQRIFDAQVAAINHVQRLPPAWNEIDYYCRRGGRNYWNTVRTFPCTDEFHLAEVVFHVEGKRYRATLTSIGGHIFDFAILQAPAVRRFRHDFAIYGPHLRSSGLLLAIDRDQSFSSLRVRIVITRSEGHTPVTWSGRRARNYDSQPIAVNQVPRSSK